MRFRRRTFTRARAIAFLIALSLTFPLVAQEARWKELSAQVEQLQKQGKYAEALPVAQAAVRVAEATFGAQHPNTAAAVEELGEVYQAQGKYAEAEPLFKRALEIREKAFGPESPEVAQSLNSLGDLYRRFNLEGNNTNAEPLLKRSLAIREKALGSEHADVAVSLDNLAFLYWNQGRYAEAEALFTRALAIKEKALGTDHPDVATSLDNLANVYNDQGKYAEAEPLFKHSLAINEKTLGPEHLEVASSLSSLARLYWEQGKYAEAEALVKRALAIREKALGAEHPGVAKSLNNLALLYKSEGKYAAAEPLFTRALAIQEKARGASSTSVALVLTNLADLYTDEGKYAEAEPLYTRCLAIWEKALGPEHPVVAQGLTNLAELYRKQGRYAQAEPPLKRALVIWEKGLGLDHPDAFETLNNSAVLYSAEGKYALAEPLFERSLSNLRGQFEQQFTYMSEKERLLFLDKVSDVFPTYLNFCLAYREQDPSLVGRMYDTLLWEKGLVASSITSLRAQIAATGDKDALVVFEQLTTKKTQLATLLTAEPDDREAWRKNVEQLQQETNDMEKELVRRSSTLAENKKLAQVTWRDVQKALGKDEAAIEFVRFRFHDSKHLTETADYVALIVTSETTTAPALVKLGDAKVFEGAPLDDYRRRAGLSEDLVGVAQPSFYQAFWKPLESALNGKQRIYISPDGVLNQVALGIVPAADGRLLIEKYDLRLVSSTKDILRERRTPAADTAVLVGAPQFDLDEAKQRELVQSLNKKGAGTQPVLVASASGVRSGDLQRGGLTPLPGAQVELQQVGSLLTKNHWRVETYSGEDALEETVKQVHGPRVLHLATHGFFLSDEERSKGSRPTRAEDPMLRSGVYFAGANRVISRVPSAPDLDDGILTAYEASGLNLQGTELVVLSACDTGLGDIKNGEGVFGLRRALQEAGAESVLMSLWAVRDRETRELMTLFYNNWLSGMDKHEALRAAQLEMRRKVKARYGRDLPNYWGGFVLVGR
jgi:CHAT domain-containing protein/Tfp pilus assembly protein PilF